MPTPMDIDAPTRAKGVLSSSPIDADVSSSSLDAADAAPAAGLSKIAADHIRQSEAWREAIKPRMLRKIRL